MWTIDFWRATAERAVKTLAQTMLALWLVGDGLLNVLNIDWLETFGVGVGAMLLSVLTSLISLGAGPTGSPSLVAEKYGRHAA